MATAKSVRLKGGPADGQWVKMRRDPRKGWPVMVIVECTPRTAEGDPGTPFVVGYEQQEDKGDYVFTGRIKPDDVPKIKCHNCGAEYSTEHAICPQCDTRRLPVGAVAVPGNTIKEQAANFAERALAALEAKDGGSRIAVTDSEGHTTYMTRSEYLAWNRAQQITEGGMDGKRDEGKDVVERDGAD
jgi:hypothetical protein